MNIALSVIIPTFNDGIFLPDAIESVLLNKNRNYEIIIVNDGSTDSKTLDLLSTLESSYKIIHQPNKGLGAARNTGILAAKGRYILPLDADNRIRPLYIDLGIKILDQDGSIDVVYGDREFFGNRRGRNRVPNFNLARLLDSNFIDACGVYRKSIWEKVGGYDEKMPSMGFEDWDLWCRMGCSGARFHHVDEILFDYRVRPQQMSVDMGNPKKMKAIINHINKKTLTITIGDYVAAYRSSDLLIERIRNTPLRMFFTLFLWVYFPNLYSYLKRVWTQ